MNTKLQQFIDGSITFAEFAGLSAEQAHAMAQIGCDLAQAGQLEDAETILSTLASFNPHDSAIQAALGTVYQKLGRPAEAEKAYIASIKGNPQNAMALANLGEMRVRCGDAAGRTMLESAVRADAQGVVPAAQRAKTILELVKRTTQNKFKPSNR